MSQPPHNTDHWGYSSQTVQSVFPTDSELQHRQKQARILKIALGTVSILVLLAGFAYATPQGREYREQLSETVPLLSNGSCTLDGQAVKPIGDFPDFDCVKAKEVMSQFSADTPVQPDRSQLSEVERRYGKQSLYGQWSCDFVSRSDGEWEDIERVCTRFEDPSTVEMFGLEGKQ